MAYKIVLDAGHGGEDPGAVYKDRKEKDDNLKLTLAVGKIMAWMWFIPGLQIFIRLLLKKRKLQMKLEQIFLFLFIATAVPSRNNTMELKY